MKRDGFLRVAITTPRRDRCRARGGLGGWKKGERRRKKRSRLALQTIPIVIGCHRKAGSPREKKSRAPRGRRGPSYTFHRWGPWGPIMGATSSLAILPQIATLKRGTAPVLRCRSQEESVDCSVHRLRLATSVLQLGPVTVPLVHPPSSLSLLSSFLLFSPRFHRVHFSSFLREPCLSSLALPLRSTDRDTGSRLSLALVLPTSAACNTVIGQFRGFPFE